LSPLPLTIVAAIAENGVIGRDNDLPWRLKTDLQRFKRLTMGKPLIMGRRNWDSIGRPLPGRRTIVLTRNASLKATGATVAQSWGEAKALAAEAASELGADEIIVAGGAEIYRLALPETKRLRLTQVHVAAAGDVVFPPFDTSLFRETFREDHPAGPDDQHRFTFLDLERRRDAGEA